MIRFINIGDQIISGDKAFAFYDTINDRFVDIDGVQVFTSLAQLDDYLRYDVNASPEWKERLRRHAISNNVPKQSSDD